MRTTSLTIPPTHPTSPIPPHPFTPHTHGVERFRESFSLPMADYDIFREQLAIKYPSYGHALWEPGPRNPDRPVQIGDVGFVRKANSIVFSTPCFQQTTHPAELGVPEYHEPLVPTLLDHLDTRSLGLNNYCSPGVSIEPDPGYQSAG
jgi:hypothetical protein